MSRSIDQRILEVASATDFVVARTDLLAAGLTASSIARRVGELLQPIAVGVYGIGEMTPRQLLRASVMVIPGSALAELSAAEQLGFATPRSEQIVVVAERGRARALPAGTELRLTRWLPVDDVAIVDGLATTTVERTICDLGRVLPAWLVQRLIERAITDREMSRRSFSACVRAYCRKGRAGSAMIRMLSHELLDEEPIPASELERRGRQLFRRGGLREVAMHFVPPWSDGVRGVVDFAWETERVIVELDGRRWHAVTKAQEEDRRRDRVAAAHGWVVLRFGWQELVERPHQVLSEIRFMLQQRRPAPAKNPTNAPSVTD